MEELPEITDLLKDKYLGELPQNIVKLIVDYLDDGRWKDLADQKGYNAREIQNVENRTIHNGRINGSCTMMLISDFQEKRIHVLFQDAYDIFQKMKFRDLTKRLNSLDVRKDVYDFLVLRERQNIPNGIGQQHADDSGRDIPNSSNRRTERLMVTYAEEHEDPAHMDSVRRLCVCLYNNRFSTCVDVTAEQFRGHGDIHQWLQHRFHYVHFVVIVISPSYVRAAEGCDYATNLHTKYLSSLIKNNVGHPSRYICLLMSGARDHHIPDFLRYQNQCKKYEWPKQYNDFMFYMRENASKQPTKKIWEDQSSNENRETSMEQEQGTMDTPVTSSRIRLPENQQLHLVNFPHNQRGSPNYMQPDTIVAVEHGE